MRFYLGTHVLSHAQHFPYVMISVNRLIKRKSDFQANHWIMDSGAFSRISSGQGHMPIDQYIHLIERWHTVGQMDAAVSQDWMCEPFILAKTGLTVADHQALTIERYETLRRSPFLEGVYILPVLQGYEPEEYASHVRQYGPLLKHGQWVGVGSICKRNSDVTQIQRVLAAIKRERPDLLLHGFGLKLTALRDGWIRKTLYSADSMAWSYAARRSGLNANGLPEAQAFVSQIASQRVQWSLL